VEAWYKEESKDDDKPAIKVTKAVQRVKAALSYIWIAKHLKSLGEDIKDKCLWKFGIFKKYPLVKEDLKAVFSLIPHLYWVHELKQPDMFRIKSPDMSTVLFVPTARISTNLDGDIFGEDYCDGDDTPSPLASSSDAYLPRLLDEVRISSLSLCSLAEWEPDMLLRNAANYFGIDTYSHDLHPTKTQYVRLYVKEAAESVLHRLKSANIATTLSSVSSIPSQMTPDVVGDLVDSLKTQLKTWYDDFVRSFNNKWKMLGDEWTPFEDVSELVKDTHYV